MRTTVRLDEHLLSQAKQLAAKTGQTLTAVIEEALRVKLAASRRRSAPVKVTLPAYGVGGVLPGVDLDDSVSLSEVMDQGNDSA
ncbi:MAG: ribbon-helix-helix protein, CopG family [Deltaproteobacteria bacterium]|nr:ribbon-helix-helix protein, CopG family [Deltaproteobacteria bacterium]